MIVFFGFIDNTFEATKYAIQQLAKEEAVILLYLINLNQF